MWLGETRTLPSLQTRSQPDPMTGICFGDDILTFRRRSRLVRTWFRRGDICVGRHCHRSPRIEATVWRRGH